ncbi:MAG: hypothetical protein GYB65_10060 [Chloroflexi bacterium]|nr:hypothetical protein [Chloroflexota bacterium]
MTTQEMLRDMLEIVCRSVSDALVAVDQAGCVHILNEAAEVALGVDATDVLGQPLADHPATQGLETLFEMARVGEEVQVDEFALPSGSVCKAKVVSPSEADRFVVLSGPAISGYWLANQMGVVVHKLKTPIASTKSLIDMVGAMGKLNKKQTDYHQRALNSMDSLLDLVHKLLDVTWLETDGELYLAQVDLGEIARQSAAELEPMAAQHQVQIALDITPAPCKVEGDERRLEDVISNLLSNAIKYSFEDSTVRLVVHNSADEIVVRVEDDGIGIEPEHLPHIFEHFYRVRARHKRRVEGSGLGLAIAQAVVEKHGSTITVQSTPGEGSTFEFALACAGDE